MSVVRPFRCFNPRLILISLLNAGLIVLFAWLGRGHAPFSAVRVLVALAQTASTAWLVLEMIRSVRGLDELEQRIHGEALVWGVAITIVVITGSGYLVKAGLPRIDWSEWVLPLMTFAWAGNVFRVMRKYR